MTLRRPQPQAPLEDIICLAKEMGSGPTVWMAKPRAKSRFGIGLVEFFRQGVRGRRFVHADEIIEAAADYVAGLRHEVTADAIAGIRKSIFKAGTSGIQQQARSFDGIACDDNDLGLLEALAPFGIEVGDAGGAAVGSDVHARDHAVGADLRAMLDGIGHMGDQSAKLWRRLCSPGCRSRGRCNADGRHASH